MCIKSLKRFEIRSMFRKRESNNEENMCREGEIKRKLKS
jgi:hypothetical protein